MIDGWEGGNKIKDINKDIPWIGPIDKWIYEWIILGPDLSGGCPVQYDDGGPLASLLPP